MAPPRPHWVFASHDASLYGATRSLLLLLEALLLSMAGGGAGIALAYFSAAPLRKGIFGTFFPMYSVAPETVVWGIVITAVIGVVAGVGPAVGQARLDPTAALRSEG